MTPTKKQWKQWSLPSKYTAIGLVITVLSLGLYFNDKISSYFQTSNKIQQNKDLYIYEKNKNLKLLTFLTKKLSGEELQRIIFQANYLSLVSLDMYYNADKTKQIIELKNILKSINIKIKALKEANGDMLTGNFKNMQKAMINFSNINEQAKKAILLYKEIGI